MRHYLGSALLDAGRAFEAEAVYRRDLKWHKNNGWSLFGLWKSLEKQGKINEADQTYQDFKKSWADSDITLTRSRI
jgi:hypothetical protein